VLRISYDVNYLRPTIMRKFINNGIDVSMRKHFQVRERERERERETRVDAYRRVQRDLPDTHVMFESGALLGITRLVKLGTPSLALLG
jgi:hypothetical protein